MADLNARIKPKKSSTTGEVPQAADLEVAEIAVNTADGKLFVKHTDNSIKEISGGTDITTESIDALSDVDTTTTPPTDGQTLTWVDANNRWEPAAAGGAVDSVNGQTGVVALDLDDLNDVKSNLGSIATYSTGITFANPSNLDTPGEWGYQGTIVDLYKEDDNGVDRTAQLSALKNGDTFDFSFQGGALTTATMVADAEDELGDGSVWRLDTNISIGTYGDGATLQLHLASTGPTDGQVLAWVDANSQWEAVSLGVADLNDYQAPVIPGAWVGTWEIDTLSAGQLKNAGYCSPSNDNGGGGNFAYNDQATGTDYSTELSALSGGTVYFRVGNNAWTSGSVGTVTLNTSGGASLHTVLFGCVPLQTALNAATVGDLVYLSNQPNGVTSADPTDGQVLTWVDANGQWEPATPTAGATELDELTDVSVPTAPADATLVLEGEGADGGTVFTDSSPNALTPTATRNVTTDTSIFKYGSSSMRFVNGGIDYADSAATKVGTTNGNFTIETWMYRPTGDPASTVWFASKRVALTTDHSFSCWWDSGVITLRVSFNGTTLEDATVTAAPNVDQWYHIALVREGTTCRIYVDGVNVLNNSSAFSSSGPIFDTTASLCIGTYQAGLNGSYWYSDDFAITDGVAKYSANFTPGPIPAGPTDGQVLTWIDANSQWEPATPAASGAASSPAIVYASTDNLTAGTSTSLVLPTTIAAGDTIAIHLMARGNALHMPTIDLPASYTAGPTLQRNDTTASSSATSNAIFYKTAIAADAGATVNFTLASVVDSNYFFTAAVWVVRGASYRISYLDGVFALGNSSGTSGHALNNTQYIAGDAIVGIAQMRPWSAFSAQVWRYTTSQGATLNQHYAEGIGAHTPTSSMVSTSGAYIQTGTASSSDPFVTTYSNTSSSPVYSVIRFAAL